jgi:peptidoglycan/LPS O-acetylase OafA/YrhL
MLVGVVIGLRETVNHLGLVDNGLYITMLALGTALVLWSIAESPSDVAPSGSWWLQMIGKSSYEIYLTHMFVVLATAGLFRASGAALSWVFGFYLAATLGSVALGWLVARYFGRPLTAALRNAPAQRKRAAQRPSV